MTETNRCYVTPLTEPGDRIPYAGEGADGCRRSAAVDLSKRDALPLADFEGWASLTASASRWNAQADRLAGVTRLDCPECRGTHNHTLACSRRTPVLEQVKGLQVLHDRAGCCDPNASGGTVTLVPEADDE